MNKLEKYIRNRLQEGYSVEQIATYLANHGYNKLVIDKIFDHIYKRDAIDLSRQNTNNDIVHFSLQSIVIMIILTSFMIGGFLIISQNIWGEKNGMDTDFLSEKELLDVEINTENFYYESGNELSFQVELTNFGSKKRYDIELVHEIFYYEPFVQNYVDTNGSNIDHLENQSSDNSLSYQNSQIINRKTETLAIETKGSILSKIKIPEKVKPGKYILKTTANYDMKSASSSVMFEIEIENVN